MVSSSPPQAAPPRGPCPFVRHRCGGQHVCPVLAELGADVVKIESKDRPEALRTFDAPSQAELFEPSGVRTTALFAGLTRGMRSVVHRYGDTRGPRHLSRIGRSGGRGHREPGPGHDGGVGLFLRGAAGAQSNPGHDLDLGLRKIRPPGELPGLRLEHQQLPGSDVGLGARRDPFRLRRWYSRCKRRCRCLGRGRPGCTRSLHRHGTDRDGCGDHGTLVSRFSRQRPGMEHRTQRSAGGTLLGRLPVRGSDAWVAIELEDADDWDTMCAHLDRHDLRLGDREPLALVEALREAIGAWAALSPLSR